MDDGDTAERMGRALEHWRLSRGWSQRDLARRAGVSHAYVALLEKGRLHSPGKFRLDAVARALGLLGADALLESVESAPEAHRPNVVGTLDQLQAGGAKPLLPVFRWGSCGDPRDRDCAPDPDHLDYAPLGKELLIGPHGFGVLVRGSSMADRDIHDGDVVWVNPDRPVRVGGVVLARVWDAQGEEVGMVVKVLRRDEAGERLWGDGEGEEGRNPVVGSRYEIVGPVVLVSPAPHPPR